MISSGTISCPLAGSTGWERSQCRCFLRMGGVSTGGGGVASVGIHGLATADIRGDGVAGVSVRGLATADAGGGGVAGVGVRGLARADAEGGGVAGVGVHGLTTTGVGGGGVAGVGVRGLAAVSAARCRGAVLRFQWLLVVRTMSWWRVPHRLALGA